MKKIIALTLALCMATQTARAQSMAHALAPVGLIALSSGVVLSLCLAIKKFKRRAQPSAAIMAPTVMWHQGKKVTVRQLHVAYQKGGATCGYHALKNALCIGNALEHPACAKEWLNRARSNYFAASRLDNARGSWRTCIQQTIAKQLAGVSAKDRAHMNYAADGSWLDEFGIQKLATALRRNRALSGDVIVLANSDIQKNDLGRLTQLQQNGIHRVVLGSMNPGTHDFGHWIALVIHRRGNQVEYIFADSFNHPIPQTLIHEVIGTLESREITVQYRKQLRSRKGWSAWVKSFFRR